MKKRVQSFWFIGAVILFLSVGALNAQQATPQSPSADPQAQQPPATPDQTRPPATPEQAQPNQTPSQTPDQAAHRAPEPEAQSAQPEDVQSFTGTILKSGDKYVLQSSGTTYDLDHQDQLQKYENKKVKVHGTLDASGNLIRLQ